VLCVIPKAAQQQQQQPRLTMLKGCQPSGHSASSCCSGSSCRIAGTLRLTHKRAGLLVLRSSRGLATKAAGAAAGAGDAGVQRHA
jgi:hypothetical protein